MPDYMTDAGLLEHLRIQKLNISEFKTDAGADAADQQSIAEDYDNMRALLDFCPLADEYKTSAFAIKRTVLRGEIGAAVGKLMSPPVLSSPFDLTAGIEKRSRERDGRFKRAKTITQAALDALDLADEKSDSLSPDDVKPEIHAAAAQFGYLFSVVVSNRTAADSWDVLVKRAGQEKWSVQKTATGKSVDVVIEPVTSGKPEQLQVMIQLKKNNQNYGQPSDIVYVTVNP